MTYVRKYAKKTVKRTAKRTYKRRPTVSKKASMVKLIKSVVHKQAENKVSCYSVLTGLANAVANNSGWTTNNVVPLSPYTSYMDIAQGTGQGQRIGNKIQTRKCFIKFMIYPNKYDAIQNALPTPQDVRIVIVKWKDSPTQILQYAYLNQFFQTGNGSSSPNGTLLDIVRDINTDRFTVCYDKVIKVGFASETGTGASSIGQYFANNDYKLNVIRKIDCTKWCPKTILYNDTGAIPENPLLQMLVFPCGCENTYATANTFPLLWYYQTHYEYEDM